VAAFFADHDLLFQAHAKHMSRSRWVDELLQRISVGSFP
jgi:hypothetical protein